MDVGDSSGDLYFVMRSVVGPIECAAEPTAEDCTDREVVATNLMASALVVEIDSKTGGYGHCNICTNTSSKHSYCKPSELGQYKCTGWVDLHKVGMEHPATAHRTNCEASMPNWECWRNRVALKFGGTWWSFFNQSYCGGGGLDMVPVPQQPATAGAAAVAEKGCSWRVVRQLKSINNSCLLDRVYSSIEGYNKSCFSRCAKPTQGLKRNVSDPAWIECVYTTVLGENASTPGNVSLGGGMPPETVVRAWEAAFAPDGTAGACPSILPPTPAAEPTQLA
jgi:hypothetical protein